MIIIIILFHLFLLFFTQFTAWPEVVSFPFFLQKGFVINKDFIHPYPPFLTYFLSNVFSIFGFKLLVLKIFAYLFIIVSDIFMYLIIKKISNTILALLFLFFYIFAQVFLEGNMLWFDTALIPFLLISIYFFLSEKYLLTGLFLSFTILTKQSALIYLATFMIVTLFVNFKIKNILKLVFYPTLLTLILCINFIFRGTLIDNFNWLFYYPLKYWSDFPSYLDFFLTRREIFIIFLLLSPAIFLLKNFKKNAMFILLIIASLIAIYPRFSFFHAQALIAISFISMSLLNKKIVFIWLILLIFVLKPYIYLNMNNYDRFWSTSEIYKADVIKKVVNNQTIFLLGPNSIYYVLSNNIPPKPFIDGFGWYWEIPGLSDKVLLEWEKQKPNYIYWTTPKDGNWYDLATYQNKHLTKWIESNYNKKDIVWEDTYLWQKKN